tara:strand:+ start:814 stop:1176 length:363 start_codon:yes stop_codon:yes gene_type:complete
VGLKKVKKKPDLESVFLKIWREVTGLPPPEREYQFHPTRRWRLDFAWLKQRVAVEIQGGVFLKGRTGHTSGVGVQRDCEKGNAATSLGWRVLHFTTQDLRQKPVQCCEQVIELLNWRFKT